MYSIEKLESISLSPLILASALSRTKNIHSFVYLEQISVSNFLQRTAIFHPTTRLG